MERYVSFVLDEDIKDEACCTDFNIAFITYKDENENNLMRICYLMKCRIKLFTFLFLSGMFNLNEENKRGKTIMHDALKKSDSLTVIKLIKMGYNNFDIPYSEDLTLRKKLKLEYSYLFKNNDETFNIYEHDEFTIKKRLGTGSYGTVYIGVRNEDRKIFALKTTNNEEFSGNIPFDIFKEIMIMKIINKAFPTTTCKICGIYITDERKIYTITEYIPYTLKDILMSFQHFELDLKKEILMKIFKNIIIATDEMNQCGFCHFDIKPANILITSNFEVRIIDMGMSTFIGLERCKIKEYTETLQVKAPDDSVKTFAYLSSNGQRQFIKTSDYRVNYSSDMFSIGVMIFSSVIGRSPDSMIQMISTKKDRYYFLRNDECNVKLSKLTKIMETKISSFSEYLMDFLTRSMIVDSSVRMNCKDAIQHPFFTNGKINCLSQIPYSITDIHSIDCLKENVYTSSELLSNLHELKYSEDIIRIYSEYEIPNSSLESDESFNKVIITSDILDRYIQFGFDEYCNYLIIDSIHKLDTGDYLSSDESIIVINMIQTMLRNKSIIEDDLEFFDMKYKILSCELSFIPFNTLIIGKTNIMRIEGYSEKKISNFYNLSHIWLINFLQSKRPQSIKIKDLISVFEILANGNELNDADVWIYDLLGNEFNIETE